MKMQLYAFSNATAKSRKHREEHQSFSNCFSSARSKTFLHKTPKHTTISSHKKLYRIQAVEFLITEHLQRPSELP